MDGTEWKIRGSKVQFLTLAILFDGVALPIAFIDLEKIGHSSQQERIDWFKRLTEQFDFKGMTLIADREYIGLQWFEALRMTFDLNFIVRLKKGIYHNQVNDGPGKTQAQMIDKLKRCRRKKMISKRVIIGSAAWYYIIIRNPKAGHPDEDDFIFLLSSWYNRTAAAEAYARRWAIEVTFRHLKSNGFRLEDMRVEGKEKRETMMAILNLVFVLCVIEGRKFYQRHPRSRQTKTDHQTGRVTIVHSVFRQGLSRVLATFTTLEKLIRRLNQIYRREPHPVWAFV
jgi:transposase